MKANTMIFLSLLVIASISAGALGGSLPVENLDLRVVSQLRVELRHIQRTEEQCELFWKGLRDKLGDQDGNQLDRTATLKKLSERLQSRRSFEKLAEFVDRCVSGRFEDSNDAGSDQLEPNPAELAELRNKVQSLEAAARGREEQASKLALMEEKVRALENDLGAKDGQNKEATQQVKDLTSMEEKVRALEAELSAKDGKVKEASEQVKDLAAVTDKLKSVEMELRKRDERINELMEAREASAKRLEDHSKDHIEQASKLATSLATMQQKITSLESELKAKQTEVHELSAAKDLLASRLEEKAKEYLEQTSKLSSALDAMHKATGEMRVESTNKEERMEQMRKEHAALVEQLNKKIEDDTQTIAQERDAALRQVEELKAAAKAVADNKQSDCPQAGADLSKAAEYAKDLEDFTQTFVRGYNTIHDARGLCHPRIERYLEEQLVDVETLGAKVSRLEKELSRAHEAGNKVGATDQSSSGAAGGTGASIDKSPAKVEKMASNLNQFIGDFVLEIVEIEKMFREKCRDSVRDYGLTASMPDYKVLLDKVFQVEDQLKGGNIAGAKGLAQELAKFTNKLVANFKTLEFNWRSSTCTAYYQDPTLNLKLKDFDKLEEKVSELVQELEADGNVPTTALDLATELCQFASKFVREFKEVESGYREECPNASRQFGLTSSLGDYDRLEAQVRQVEAKLKASQDAKNDANELIRLTSNLVADYKTLEYNWRSTRCAREDPSQLLHKRLGEYDELEQKVRKLADALGVDVGTSRGPSKALDLATSLGQFTSKFVQEFKKVESEYRKECPNASRQFGLASSLGDYDSLEAQVRETEAKLKAGQNAGGAANMLVRLTSKLVADYKELEYNWRSTRCAQEDPSQLLHKRLGQYDELEQKVRELASELGANSCDSHSHNCPVHGHQNVPMEQTINNFLNVYKMHFRF